MSTLKVDPPKQGELFQFHNFNGVYFQRFAVSGFGEKGDSVLLTSRQIYDLEIEGSVHPFRWEQDGPNAVRLTLVEKWHGYMLIPVLGRSN